MNKIVVVSYNVNGVNNPIKRKKIISQLKRLNCSIALLQETHLDEKEHQKLKRDWVGQVISSTCGEGKKKRGVAILCHRALGLTIEKTFTDKKGRYVMMVGNIGNVKVSILNLYAPNEDDPSFFKEITVILTSHAEGFLLVGGDFNCVLNQHLDKKPFEPGPTPRKTKLLHNTMQELGLMDIWRHKHPKEKEYTFFSKVHNSYSRIDFFCVSKRDAYKVTNCYIDSITISDHAPVVLSLNLQNNNEIRQWRLNVSLLNNPKVVNDIKQEWKNYLENNDNGETSLTILWEAAKAVLRGKIIAISSKIKKDREKKQKKLEKDIMDLQREHQQTNDKNTLKSLNHCRQTYNDLLTNKAEGALRFANQRYYESGNRASRLLAFQLRKAQANRSVAKILNPSSKKVVSHPKDVAEAFSAYYEKLYDSPDIANREEKIKAFLEKIKMPKLTKTQAETLVEPITKIEIENTIKNLKNNKSPGIDGYPGEFYKCFKDEILPLLQKVFNHTLIENDPPKSWSQAIISVIHKEGKDPASCASYRPISLLCCDMKILTAILAKRIQKYIRNLIKPDQTGFIPGRLGINNIRTTLNIMQAAKKTSEPSMLVSLDAEKAFDRVNWLYLERVLETMGFHSDFIKWIKVFYTKPISKVRVNGCTSVGFRVRRGTRQGCPLSPLLFAISIEPLAELIRKDQRIQGVSVGRTDYKISLYADDIILYLKNPLASVPPLLECLQNFGLISGYKINESKSHAMMIIGERPADLDKIVSFNWTTQGFRYLGVMITSQHSKMYIENYGKLILNLKSDLTRWEILPLSLVGRIETVKMNVLPRLLYLFQALPIWIPSSTFKILNKMISTFVWQNKKPRIRKKLLCSSKKDGGLGLPNLKLYYWAAQLRGLVEWVSQDEDTNWIKLENYAFPSVSLETAPFLGQKKWRDLKIKNNLILCTQRVWSTVRKNIGAPLTTSRALKISKIADFLPNKIDPGFSDWGKKGLLTIHQLFDGDILKSFKQLQDKYGIDSKDFYRYLQIRDYLRSCGEWEALRQPPTQIEQLMIKSIVDKSRKKIVSNLYKCLQAHLSDNSLDLKGKWELEANIVIEDEKWETMCEGVHKISNSPTWNEFNWKIMMRFFKTPYTISKYDKNKSDLCWRKCNKIGDHTHIFWDCPVLIPYWQGIQNIIKVITQVNLPLNPLYYIIGTLPEEGIEKKKVKLIQILLLVAKKMITRSWLKTSPPTLEQWLEALRKVYLMEKITAKLHLRSEMFYDLWTPVTEHFGWPDGYILA
uniref:Reverse transcriptase domain-containing protein n=1 Tax=Oryzias latipes TaxID=8090 RepID=A0A3P9KVM4_ORYLA